MSLAHIDMTIFNFFYDSYVATIYCHRPHFRNLSARVAMGN